eukprot:scaffold189224_cov36-Tisochrysis_lutea.AAC.1
MESMPTACPSRTTGMCLKPPVCILSRTKSRESSTCACIISSRLVITWLTSTEATGMSKSIFSSTSRSVRMPTCSASAAGPATRSAPTRSECIRARAAPTSSAGDTRSTGELARARARAPRAETPSERSMPARTAET